MLHKAKESKVIRVVPEFKLFKEEGRSLRLDDKAEAKLLPVAEQPLKDIIVLMRKAPACIQQHLLTERLLAQRMASQRCADGGNRDGSS